MGLNSKIVKINTKRFFLRSLTEADVNLEYLSWLNADENPYIQYTSNHSSLEDLKIYVDEKEKKSDALFLGIFTQNNCHIGNIKFEPINFEEKIATMGILIGDKNSKGKGVAVEVIKASAQFLNKQFKIKTISLGVSSNNLAAISAYQKVGFQINTQKKDYLNMILNL